MCELGLKSSIQALTINCAQCTQGLPVVDLNCALSNCLQVSSTVYTEMHIPLQFPKPFHTPLFCLEKALTLATRALCVCVRACVACSWQHAQRLPIHQHSDLLVSTERQLIQWVKCGSSSVRSKIHFRQYRLVTVQVCIHGLTMTLMGLCHVVVHSLSSRVKQTGSVVNICTRNGQFTFFTLVVNKTVDLLPTNQRVNHHINTCCEITLV